MSGPLMDVDLTTLGADFAVPIFVFQGADDNIAPAELAEAYVKSLRAPQKQFVAIADGGHVAMMAKSAEFLRLLDQWARPLRSPAAITERERNAPVPLPAR